MAAIKLTNSFYSRNGYLGKYGGRSNKRSQRDRNACDGDMNIAGRDDDQGEGHMYLISNSCLEQTSNMQAITHFSRRVTFEFECVFWCLKQ